MVSNTELESFVSLREMRYSVAPGTASQVIRALTGPADVIGEIEGILTAGVVTSVTGLNVLPIAFITTLYA
jgi:hypothetical protein